MKIACVYNVTLLALFIFMLFFMLFKGEVRENLKAVPRDVKDFLLLSWRLN